MPSMEMMKERTRLLLLAFTLQSAILLLLDRIPWCALGDWSIWISESAGSHTSQHFFDPYSFSHVQHGLFFYFLLYLLRVPGGCRLGIVLFLEGLWEAAENTPMVIDRYRTATVALNYYGDSIANSLGDLLSCLFGFTLAARLPRYAAVLLYLLIEVLMLASIRDSLSLNVLMLLYPLEIVKAWQSGIY